MGTQPASHGPAPMMYPFVICNCFVVVVCKLGRVPKSFLGMLSTCTVVIRVRGSFASGWK